MREEFLFLCSGLPNLAPRDEIGLNQKTMKSRLIFAMLGLFAIASCHSHMSEEDMATLREAAAIHNEAYELQKQTDGLMAEIAEYKNAMLARLASRNEELDPGDAEAVDTMKALLVEIENLENELADWKAELVEVEIPGEEHDHDHGDHDHADHDHSHSHDPKVDITPAQMLELQKEQKNLISNLYNRAGQIRAQASKFASPNLED